MNQRGGELTLRHIRGSNSPGPLDRVTVELALGSENELGEVAVADDPPELVVAAGSAWKDCHRVAPPSIGAADRAGRLDLNTIKADGSGLRGEGGADPRPRA